MQMAICVLKHTMDNWQFPAGLQEGEEIDPAGTYMLAPIVAGAFGETAEVKELIRDSIDSRGGRKDAYKV